MRDEIPVPTSHRSPPQVSCPECAAPLAGTYERCPSCALPLRGPVAAELWRLDGALAGLRTREAELLLRRDHLLGLLGEERTRLVGGGPPIRQTSPATGEPAPVPGAAPPLASPSGPPGGGGGVGLPERPGVAPGPGRDLSPRAVQSLLLGVGGLLLVVAAVVFTVVSWGNMGLGGRAAVLAAVTGLTFAAPVLLVRRGLVSTAETIALFGVALLFLDGYAAWRTGLAGADGLEGPHYAALLFALVALAVAGYSRLLPLRTPLPVAVVLAQFPLVLPAFYETASWIAHVALAVTAAADAAFLVRRAARGGERETSGDLARKVPGRVPAGRRGVRTTVAACFGVVWGLGVCHGLLGSFLQLLSPLPAGAAAASSVRGVLLVVLAVMGLAVARGVRDTGCLAVVTAVSAFALAAGLAAPVWPMLPHTWWVVPYTVAALVTVAVMRYAPGLDEPRVRSVGAVSAGVLATLTALPSAAAVGFTLFAPFDRLGDIWSGSPAFAEARLIAPFPQFPVVSGLLAVASIAAALRGRAAMGFAALATGALAVAVAPVAFGWGHAVDLTVLLALAVALVVGTALAGRPRWAGALAVAAGTVSAVALATALADRTSTYAALAVLLAAWGAAAFTARLREARALSLVVGALAAPGLVWAVCAGTRWLPAGDALSLSLAVGAVLAALLVFRRPVVGEGRTVSSAPEAEKGRAISDPEGGEAFGPKAGQSREALGSETGESKVGFGLEAEEGRRGGDLRWATGLVLSAVLAVFAVLSAHTAVAATLAFHRPLVRPWTAVDGPAGRYPLLAVVIVLVAVAAVLISWQVARWRGALRAVLLAWPAVLVALPVSVALPYSVEVGLFVAGVVPTAWVVARGRAGRLFGGVAALWAAFVAISWALMSEPATLIVLPVVAAVAVAVALGERATPVTTGPGGQGTPVAAGSGDRATPVAPVAAGMATLLAGGEALAGGLALDRPVAHAVFGLLAVACVAAALAAWFRRARFAAGVEAAGYALAAAGLSLASDGLPSASLAFAVVGVLLTGTALRPDRRWAGYAGTGFLLLASWLRLLASDVSVVEAYTVPFSLVLLAFGWWRARGGKVSSWIAYGSGLASSLVPSVLALLAGSGWLRPLLLGTVSLAMLLAGARFRLQAPAVLGGLALAVVALHELAPWLVEVAVLVPRWVPMALGGLLLVSVGATYEARLRDVRRLRAAVGRMR
ncbi:SCO7613 C-terminal domain-containing membrane protein [Streptosporangium sp. CA-115845]|uniref:SCO7613 C-terminal domain-containing membrane protein n=1 Tax=Streptosporangium sp. CA-115845 TaxID=3240071 RepID=UPI003D91A9E1